MRVLYCCDWWFGISIWVFWCRDWRLVSCVQDWKDCWCDLSLSLVELVHCWFHFVAWSCSLFLLIGHWGLQLLSMFQLDFLRCCRALTYWALGGLADSFDGGKLQLINKYLIDLWRLVCRFWRRWLALLSAMHLLDGMLGGGRDVSVVW